MQTRKESEEKMSENDFFDTAFSKMYIGWKAGRAICEHCQCDNCPIEDPLICTGDVEMREETRNLILAAWRNCTHHTKKEMIKMANAMERALQGVSSADNTKDVSTDGQDKKVTPHTKEDLPEPFRNLLVVIGYDDMGPLPAVGYMTKVGSRQEPVFTAQVGLECVPWGQILEWDYLDEVWDKHLKCLMEE